MTLQDSATDRAPRHGLGDKMVLGASAVLAAGALAFGGISLTNAWFTSEATVDGQNISTGTVEIEAGIAAEASPIAVSGLLPGDEAQTILAVTNTGSEDVYLTVGPFTATGSVPLRAAVEVSVVADGVPAVTRQLDEWEDGAIEGIALGSGDTKDITVTVTLSTEAGDELQDTQTQFSVAFAAIQARNFDGTTTPTWVDAD